MSFKYRIAVTVALALLGSSGAAYAQQDLKPLQAEVENLKQQVSRLQADLKALKSVPTPTPIPAPTILPQLKKSSGGSAPATKTPDKPRH